MANPTPQPAPTPQTQNQKDAADFAKSFAGIDLTPGGKKSSGSNAYGLDAATAALLVHGAGSLFPVQTGTDGTATALDVVKGFANLHDPAAIAKIQDLLYKGGYYGNPSSVAPPTYGALTTEDVFAFAKLAGDGALNQADLPTMLRSRASTGQKQGIQNAIDRINASQKGATIQQANPNQVGAAYDAEFKVLMGHKPSPAERAGFIVGYQHAFAAAQSSANAAIAPKPPSILEDHLANSGPTAADIAANAGPPADPLNPDQVQARIGLGTVAPDPTVLPPAFDAVSYTENQIRNAHPNETGAHDLTSQFSNFLGIIGGIK